MTLSAHKVILAQGSTSFAERFKATGLFNERVEIQSDDYRVAYAMIAHLYGLHYDFDEEKAIEQPIDPSSHKWEMSSSAENYKLVELICLASKYGVKALVDSSMAKFTRYVDELWEHDKSEFEDIVEEVFNAKIEPQQQLRQIIARIVATNFNKDNGDVDLPKLVREIPDLAVEALKLLAEQSAH